MDSTDIGKASIEFIHSCMDAHFSDLMEAHAIENMEWLEIGEDEARAFAYLENTNLVVLFPPLNISNFNK
tara:strand:- start:435 stop:644 length:210 start_codon:yes stop_codon:yes gene_type:complete